MLNETIEHIINNEDILERNTAPQAVRVDNFCGENAEGDSCLLIDNDSIKYKLWAWDYFWVVC